MLPKDKRLLHMLYNAEVTATTVKYFVNCRQINSKVRAFYSCFCFPLMTIKTLCEKERVFHYCYIFLNRDLQLSQSSVVNNRLRTITKCYFFLSVPLEVKEFQWNLVVLLSILVCSLKLRDLLLPWKKLPYTFHKVPATEKTRKHVFVCIIPLENMHLEYFLFLLRLGYWDKHCRDFRKRYVIIEYSVYPLH